MSVRLVYKAVLNGQFYMNNRYLRKGCNIVYRTGGRCKQLVMYSSSYVSRDKNEHGVWLTRGSLF